TFALTEAGETIGEFLLPNILVFAGRKGLYFTARGVKSRSTFPAFLVGAELLLVEF
ncbi:MAG: hypothetical protein ACJAW3_001257, partial [Lentimonas sp.]